MKILSRAAVFFLIILLFCLAPDFRLQAANNLDVAINEVAWMGTKVNSSDEWIELYNNTNQAISLEGWGLYEAGGEILIEPLTGVIEAKSYYLIERTDDTTISDIPASQEPSSWGGYGLKNSGEHLQLLDQNSTIIDEVNCSDSWFAGDNLSKQTMERKNPSLAASADNWRTSQNSGGTPKAENNKQITENEEQRPEEAAENISLPTEEETMDESKSPTIEFKEYPAGIVLNEILPSPEGPDEKDEWIEIFNQNNFEVDISNWKITDIAGKTETYTFPQITKIPAQGFLVLSRPTTKITLNNDEDGLLLIQPNGNILDSVNYQKALRGQSYNRTESNWVWSSVLTPASKNILTQPDIKKEVEEKSEIETQKSKDSPETKSQLASVGEQIPKSSKIFLIAFGLAIFSGVIILIIKRKLKNASDID